ncbi:MAG: tetratricopeptide repeat protein [Bacteroidota bacterium]
MNSIQEAKKYFDQAVAHCEAEKFEEAIPIFTKAIDAFDEPAAPFYNRAKAYYKLGKFEEAVADFGEAIDREPKNPEFYSARGIAHHQIEQQNECLSDMDKAVSLDPENGYRYSSRAFLKARVGMVMSAMKDYEKAIELDPDDAIAYNNLGMLQEQLGYEGFQKNFDRADNLTGGRREEKPDLKKVVADYEAQKAIEQNATKAERERSTRLSPQYFFKTLQDVLTSRETQREFFDFLSRRK